MEGMRGFWNLTSTISLTLSILYLFVYNDEDVSAVPTRHLCRPDQRDALLQFKNEFEVQNSSISYYRCIYSGIKPHEKTESWMNNSDCCNLLGGQFHSNSSLQNLHSLTTLDLTGNRFSGQIMSSIGNFSHLTSLNLSQNNFSGFIPSSIVDLSYLIFLDFSINSFSGQIPSSIGNLSHLTYLDLSSTQILGQILSSIGNLYKITYLDLSNNNIVGEIPSSFGYLNQLTSLYVGLNRLNGSFPIALLNLTELSSLSLSYNQFTGIIPHNITSLSSLLPSSPFLLWMLLLSLITNSTELLSLGLYLHHLSYNNNLRGPIPETISKFTNLEELDLSHYNTQGPIDFSIFSHLKLLDYLDLSHVNTTTTIDLNDFLSNFRRLDGLFLSGNHVSATNKIPVSGPPLLRYLHLSGCETNNKIKGQVPGWLWTLPNLTYLNLSNNTFTSFKNSTKHGLSMINLLASNNNFTGNIPSFICGWRSLATLDLSNNYFSGGIPETIFESLRTLDVGHNHLTGKLPRSLIHFSSLEVLNMESNIINDMYPFWLSSLPELKILVLRSNVFHGPIHQTSFPKLQIIDISHNHFNGALPSDFFVKWSAMSSLGTVYDQQNKMYMGDSYYHDLVVLMNKGLEMKLQHILKIYTALDFSGNKLEGEIPRSIGLLKELHVLNLSNNAFTGVIPSSMGNLTALESLDVSQNQFSGEICKS
ncbi:hypothetical protein HID58_044421 [Brassica napus]|uniref:Leucine-rich repeat-containing N-terminal plant-type domain-containing protein n=1 Tax=Brassica napus TaxID=3708 RepID=A0ABQ8BJG4_BRANA|nr:hypothetical protein HID58_044421 [Brassica napus]